MSNPLFCFLGSFFWVILLKYSVELFKCKFSWKKKRKTRGNKKIIHTPSNLEDQSSPSYFFPLLITFRPLHFPVTFCGVLAILKRFYYSYLVYKRSLWPIIIVSDFLTLSLQIMGDHMIFTFLINRSVV
jgi:hypothetical protein